jgi:hypothetical protein
MLTLSWLPRVRWIDSGQATLRLRSNKMTSTEKLPRSTKSPLKTYGFSALGIPFFAKIESTRS